MDRPEIWFLQVEAQTKINGIIPEESKFNYSVSQLEAKYIEKTWDIVTSKSVTKYSESKTRLPDLFIVSESARIKKLIIGMISVS